MLVILGLGIVFLAIINKRNHRNSRRRSRMFDRQSQYSNRRNHQDKEDE